MQVKTTGKGRELEGPSFAPVRIGERTYSMEKGYSAGTHRMRHPADTLREYSRLATPLGITRLANLTGLDHIGLPVWTALRPNSRSIATSLGKGLDHDSAKASALMESIELWHAENIRAPLLWDSYLALRRRASVVDVTALPRYAGTDLRLDLPQLWIEGHDLVRQEPTWVPFEVVSMNFVYGSHHVPTYHSSSNGLASGNHLLEAIVHGLCEVVERDAGAVWHADDELRLLDLDTVDDPFCRQAIAWIERSGVRLAAWDMSTDTDVPVYGALLVERPDQPAWRDLGVAYGFGCHLSPGIALLRALTEAAQTRLAFIAGSRDDIFRHNYALTTDEEALAGIETEITAPGSRLDFADRPSLATNSFEGDIATLLTALDRAGVDSVVVVDLAQPELAIPVVKVIVPGLDGLDSDLCNRGKRALARMKETL